MKNMLFFKWIYPISPSKLKGLKVTTIGFLTIIVGTLLYAFKLEIIGRIIIYLGFLASFIGLFWHTIIFFRK